MTFIIDTHMHVFRSDLTLAASRRYTPAYDASWEEFTALSKPFGVTAAVIIQPSFLGTDNSFILQCIQAAAGCARGVAVIDPLATTTADLDALHAGGVRGIRLNLLSPKGVDLPNPTEWAPVFDHIRPLGWHVELHVASDRLAPLLDWLEPLNLTIIVDHFGRPDSAKKFELGADEPGFKDLVARGGNPNLFCKVSAPYRLAGAPAQPYFDALASTFTIDRLLW
ncbi:MAG: amidohydrolase family protein, partial [Cyanobacteria bacterium P01_C01_bin.120]